MARQPTTQRRKPLGRGLSALLPKEARNSLSSTQTSTDQVRQIPIDRIDINPDQPRRIFRQESLDELAASLRADGMIQPVIVQAAGERYTLIVGERRLRASRIAGFDKLPAIVRDFPRDRILEITLAENIQREDLNPIEIGLALKRMVDELRLSHEEIAVRTGKDRTTITNFLRLLRLPKDIQQLVAERRISGGHARALLPVGDAELQRGLAEKTAAQGLSVRQVERIVRGLTEPRKKKQAQETDPNVAAAVEEMERVLGTKVRMVQRGAGTGRIEIEYYSADDLDRIYSTIVKDNS